MATSEYRRRTPEDTLLHEVVREHLWEFFQRAEARAYPAADAAGADGEGLPRYVRQTFYGYLDCGVLARGFMRIRCPDCGYDTVVGFS